MDTKHRVEFLVPVFLFSALLIVLGIGMLMHQEQKKEVELVIQTEPEELLVEEKEGVEEEFPVEVTSHVLLPEEVRGIYWTAVTATNARADQLIEYMLETGLNAVVIDVKMDNGQLLEVEDFREVLVRLADAGIYRIARIAVMRDGAFAWDHPSVALRSLGGGYWTDSIGSVWVDPSAQEVSDYAIELGRRFYEAGFDEIQYDYVRFASDGAVNATVYPVYDHRETKVEVMQRFFQTVGGTMHDEGIPVSFDVFGMTFESHHDYNIGQRLADVFPFADWVSPMVYPSHYPDGFKGLGNPALYPYEIVKMALDSGTHLMLGMYSGTEEELRSHWRPWLQDFDIGAVYTSTLIEAQIQAARDAGASGWILWNARNVYEPANYLP
ncbi:hypothetical protein HQ487_00260 [Candidatus Uhrbacteria bacterium]|nr:hypothetical protein [Candidatus Uhrbacteria bacterium]